VVSSRETERAIELEYSFDRLSSCKISQAYLLVVPEKSWRTGFKEEPIRQESGEEREGCSDLRKGIVG